MSVLEEDIEACFAALRQPRSPQPVVADISGLSPIKSRVKPLEVSFIEGKPNEPGKLSRRGSMVVRRVLSSSDNSPTKTSHQPTATMDFQPTRLTSEEQILVQEIWERRVGVGPEAYLSSAGDLIRLLERLGINEVGAIRTHLEKLYTLLTLDTRGNASKKLFYGQFLDILQRCKTLALVVQARRMHEAWKDVRSPVRSRGVESVHRSRHVESQQLTEGDLLQVFGALSQPANKGAQKHVLSPRRSSLDGSENTSRTDSQLLPDNSHLNTPHAVSAQRLEEFAKQYNLFPQALIPADYLTEAAEDEKEASSSLTDHPTPDLGPDSRALASLGDTSHSHLLLGSLDGAELIDEVRPGTRPGSPRAAILDPKYRNQQITTDDLSTLLEGGDEDDLESLDEDGDADVDMWANNPHCSVLDVSEVGEKSYWEEAEALSAAYAPPNRRKGDNKGAPLQSGLLVQPVDEFLTHTQRKSVFSSLREPNPTTVLFNKRKAEKQQALDRGEILRVPTRAQKAEQWEQRREKKLQKNEEVIANATKFLKEKFSTLKSTR